MVGAGCDVAESPVVIQSRDCRNLLSSMARPWAAQTEGEHVRLVIAFARASSWHLPNAEINQAVAKKEPSWRRQIRLQLAKLINYLQLPTHEIDTSTVMAAMSLEAVLEPASKYAD